MNEQDMMYLKSQPRELIEAAADLLAEAYDYMYIHGWCQYTSMNSQGNVCLVGAMGAVSNFNLFSMAPAAYRIAQATVQTLIPLYTSIPIWNDEFGRTQDEVLDVMRQAEKELRNIL